MRRTTVIAGAAVCGAASFLWSLVSRMPPEDSPASRGSVGFAMGAMSISGAQNWPRDLPGLTEWLSRNPDQYAAWFDLADLCRNAGDEAGARDAWDKAAESAFPHLGEPAEAFRALYVRGWSCDHLSRPEDAQIAWYKLVEFAKTRADDPLFSQSPRFWHRVGWANHRLDRDDDARAAFERSIEMILINGPRGRDRALILARNLVLLGRPTEALDALDGGSLGVDRAALEHDEILTPLRADPRFEPILRRAGVTVIGG